MRFPKDSLQGDRQEPEPRVCDAGQFQSVLLCQSWAQFTASDGIGLLNVRKVAAKDQKGDGKHIGFTVSQGISMFRIKNSLHVRPVVSQEAVNQRFPRFVSRP